MISNVLKGIIAILLVGLLVYLKHLTEAVDRVGAKIPTITVHSRKELIDMRKTNNQDSVKKFIEEESIFRIKGDVSLTN